MPLPLLALTLPLMPPLLPRRHLCFVDTARHGFAPSLLLIVVCCLLLSAVVCICCCNVVANATSASASAINTASFASTASAAAAAFTFRPGGGQVLFGREDKKGLFKSKFYWSKPVLSVLAA